MSSLEGHDLEQAAITAAWEAANPNSDDCMDLRRDFLTTRDELRQIPAFGELPADSDGNPCVWENSYSCRACTSEQVDWSDQWSCQCDDECPECGCPQAPVLSIWIGPSSPALIALWESLREAGAILPPATIIKIAPGVIGAPDGYDDVIVSRSAPRWAWEIIDETIAMDANSSAFAKDLRTDIKAAMHALSLSCEDGSEEPISRTMVDADLSAENAA